jgi:hypothetical protein
MTTNTSPHERGIAIVLALFLMSAMSVLAASMMFLSQTETYASMNYRIMSQARYAGESGVQTAAGYLLGPTYLPLVPGVNAGDPMSNYITTTSPVTLASNNRPVVLSWDPAQSNYPVDSVKTDFANVAQGNLSAGTATLHYAATATLVMMQAFPSYGGGADVVQTWEVTSDGSFTGTRTATVEVSAIVERPKVPASTYGAFAQDSTCGALTFGGNVTINSYDSTNLSGSSVPSMSTSGGDVGTNGNLDISGSVNVEGNLYSPRSGVGTCEEGAVTALTEDSHAMVSGSVMQLPATVTYPTPTIPSPSPLTTATISTTTGACALLGLASGCSTNGHDIILDAGPGGTFSLPSVSLSGQTNIVLVAYSAPVAQYNFNSLSIASQSTISAKATSSTQGVLVNIVGKNPDSTDIAIPVDMTGGSFDAVNACTGCSGLCSTCSVYDASILQFLYGGTGEIKMKGNSGAAATFYAPNAYVDYGGTSDLYGSILANRIDETGTGNIHYDRRLQRDFWVAGHPMASTFNWKRF